MSKIADDLAEIALFVPAWKPAHADFAAADVRAKLKSSYKQFHALLVWGMTVSNDTSVDEDFSRYLTEAISDVSHAYLLNLTSLYKSSRSSLRSGIENFIRVCVHAAGVNAKAIVSVHDLFAAVKEGHKGDTILVGILNRLHTFYSELCKSVHSAQEDYLSLIVPFEKLSVFSETQFTSNNEKLRDVASAINQALFWLRADTLKTAGYANADRVLDAVPRTLKRLRTSS